jgi:hypothetical protein
LGHRQREKQARDECVFPDEFYWVNATKCESDEEGDLKWLNGINLGRKKEEDFRIKGFPQFSQINFALSECKHL